VIEMERSSDSEEVQAQYRGGCGVDSIALDDEKPDNIPEKAYILEDGEEANFPENPKKALPENDSLVDLSTDELVSMFSDMLESYAERLRTDENMERLAKNSGESKDMIKFDIQLIEHMSDEDLLRSWLHDGDTDLSEFIEDWKEAEGYYETAAPLGKGVNINAGHNIGAVIVPEIWRVLSRNSVLHKMPSNDQLTLKILHNVYKEYDNPIAETCKIGYWPGGSREMEENLFSLDYVMAWGDDSTIASIRGKLSPTARFIPFHFEFGSYIVDEETQESYDEELLENIAKDFSWGDQLLCFSPLVMIIKETDNTEKFLEDLADKMEEYTENYQTGVVPEEEEMNITRTKKIARDSGQLISDWSNQTTVIEKQGLETSDVAEFHSFRFVKAHRVESLEKALETVGSVRNLQEFILATSDERRLELRDKILETNAKRIVSPGGAPPALPIPWDGKHPVNELLQWVTDERPHE